VGLLGRANCYHAATRTPGTRRIQEDIQLVRVAYFAYAWIALGTLSTWIETVRSQAGRLVVRCPRNGARLVAGMASEFRALASARRSYAVRGTSRESDSNLEAEF
jgi:hypothetical protein